MRAQVARPPRPLQGKASWNKVLIFHLEKLYEQKC
jgi:hypothetical protein